ncbi:geranylgeranyl reductase family protein [Flavobacterium psychrotolerans]|uniref:Geranylgeranyl reductase n=1 Tax=Flavobacterium psychrotolerans TaxID=2169410 RepID=A0A2U1JL33_9FLAO|nr:geranylgeranyl reductase family protein [Flavobacterium psychrotolerans]PWA05568.1 geranylgeranyl reductase [Flavobacterium psychrotolerans]
MKTFDVAIIGSGPSGASAALELAKNGISTVIIEKEILPRYKTCGGGFVFRGRKNMPFDIASVVEREFYDVDIHFEKMNVKHTTKRDNPIISMIMRDAFDNLIVEKAKENGVTLLQNHKVLDITFGEMQTIHTSEGDVKAKFIIAADGALSPVAKIAGWKETRTIIPALEYEVEVPDSDFERLSQNVRFDFDAIPYGYGWCFPKKNHLSIGVAVFSKTNSKINLKEYYATYLKTLGINEMIKESAHGFVIPISPRTDTFVQKNVFLIGDAAGFADPISAEGISNAILSGKLAAQSIVEGNLNSSIAAQLYHKKLEENLLPEIKSGLFIAKMFYEKQTLRNGIIKKYGQYLAEAMTDLFMGDRTYPKDYKKTITRKIKEIFF